MDFDCGIYAIICPSGKRYIGQSHSLRDRFRQHLRQLRAGTHNCKALQREFLAHGEQCILFAKIAIVPVQDLSFREQEQIDECPSELLLNSRMLINTPRRLENYSAESRAALSRAVTGPKNPNWGKSLSAEHRTKLSAAQKNALLNPEYRAALSAKGALRVGAKNPKARAVLCIEKDQKFGSFSDAVRWLKENGWPRANSTRLVETCRGKARSAYGYTWKYASD